VREAGHFVREKRLQISHIALRTATLCAMDSVLARASPADVQLEPFPHVVLRDVLDDALCDRLIAEFPPLDAMVGGKPDDSNTRLYYRGLTAMHDPALSPLWRETIETHVSQLFLRQLTGIFGASILATYPDFEQRFGALDALRAGLRYRDTFEHADVLLEAQPSANTPVTAEPSSVRAGHLDNPNKLFVGLFYLRHPDDDSVGGDLELYRYRAGQRPVFHGHEIADRYIEPVQTVRYEKNVLLVFLNSPAALHGVTVRELTPHTRLFLNLNAEVKEALFAIPRTPAQRARRKARAAARASVRNGRAKVVRIAVAASIVLFAIFGLLPEALHDHPYDVF
jgi:hypothetical protein